MRPSRNFRVDSQSTHASREAIAVQSRGCCNDCVVWISVRCTVLTVSFSDSDNSCQWLKAECTDTTISTLHYQRYTSVLTELITRPQAIALGHYHINTLSPLTLQLQYSTTCGRPLTVPTYKWSSGAVSSHATSPVSLTMSSPCSPTR